jgi:hypothetical protein
MNTSPTRTLQCWLTYAPPRVNSRAQAPPWKIVYSKHMFETQHTGWCVICLFLFLCGSSSELTPATRWMTSSLWMQWHQKWVVVYLWLKGIRAVVARWVRHHRKGTQIASGKGCHWRMGMSSALQITRQVRVVAATPLQNFVYISGFLV